VQLSVTSAPISRYHPGPLPATSAPATDRATSYSPSTMPLETLVEREPVGDGRADGVRAAVESGLQFLRFLDAQDVGAHRDLFRGAVALAMPSESDATALDGDTLRFLGVVGRRALDGVRLRAQLGGLAREGRLADLFEDAPFTSIPDNDRAGVMRAAEAWLVWYDRLFSQPTGSDSWIRERLEYAFAVSGQTSSGELVLTAPEYLEGHLDWFSFVARPGASLGAGESVTTRTTHMLPAPVTFRGMPSARLWEFEDARVNFGRIEADPQDLARLLLVEFALIYGNDWFVLPVDVEVGSLCRVRSLIVTNTFGERMQIAHTTSVDGANTAWRMFGLSNDLQGLDAAASPAATSGFDDVFFLPPVLGQSLQGPPIEDVLLLRDEMANMAWAVERVVQSATGVPLNRAEAYEEIRQRRADAANGSGDAPSSSMLAYRLGTSVPDYWIPLLPVQDGTAIRLRRGALPRTETEDTGDVLRPLGLILEAGRELLLHDEEVPREGARVTRSCQYSRWSDGSTHLWIGRRKQPGKGEGSSGLRFDVVEPA
jgi:hypothetical protein